MPRFASCTGLACPWPGGQRAGRVARQGSPGTNVRPGPAGLADSRPQGDARLPHPGAVEPGILLPHLAGGIVEEVVVASGPLLVPAIFPALAPALADDRRAAAAGRTVPAWPV